MKRYFECDSFLSGAGRNAGIGAECVASENISIEDLVETIRVSLPDASTRYTGQDAFTMLSFEIDKQRISALGWTPQFSIEAGMSEIIQRLSTLRRFI